MRDACDLINQAVTFRDLELDIEIDVLRLTRILVFGVKIFSSLIENLSLVFVMEF